MKLNANELKIALDEAVRMREQGEDPLFLAKSLTYLQQRNSELENVFQHLEKYLQFGFPVEEHAALVRLVAGIREKNEDIDDTKGFGL
jgi:hypothetical protein